MASNKFSLQSIVKLSQSANNKVGDEATTTATTSTTTATTKPKGGIPMALEVLRKSAKKTPVGHAPEDDEVPAAASPAPSSSSGEEDNDSNDSSEVAEKEEEETAMDLNYKRPTTSAALLLFLDQKGPGNRLMLISAAKRGDWYIVERLIRKKITIKDKRITAADPKTGETVMMVACQDSRFWVIEKLCAAGVALNTRCHDRRTAIHFAAKQCHEEIVKTLLNHGADPNLFGGENIQLPLHMAASRPFGVPQSQVLLRAGLKENRLAFDAISYLPITCAVLSGFTVLVKELLQFYAAEQVAWRHESSGDWLVHLAAHNQQTDIMSVLVLDGGANVNAQNKEGVTPLHIAAKLGDFKMARLLHSYKANPDLWDKDEKTPLHVASECGHTDIVELLVERFKANLHLRTRDGSTLMHLAAEKGFADTVFSFIKQGVPLNMPNKAGTMCLHVAAQNGHHHVVKTLISKGSNINARNKEGYTALYLSVVNNKPEIIQTLLGHGAKVDLGGGPAKESPLHIAAKVPTGFPCAEILIDSGAMIDITTEDTLETPLHYSARSGSVELLRLLLEEGADPMQVNRIGETALHIACRHCHFGIVKAMVFFVNNMRGKDSSNLINLPNNEGETSFHLAAELAKSQTHHPFEEVDIIRLLLDNGADPLAATFLTNETSLHYCARSGNPDILIEIVRQLGTAGFQTACNRQDRMGWSPLMASSEQGHTALSEMLLVYGARADVFDEHGRAALHLAAENGHRSCCEALLAYKAFVNSKSKLGMSPLHFAAQSGFADLVQILVKNYNAAINALSLNKKTPLHLAAEAGRKDVCLLLINLHADANAIDALGQNPLHLAVENDHTEIVKLFMKIKPDLVTAASKSGMTCGHIAAKNGSEFVIKELMRFNRSLVTTVRNQITEVLPIHLAVSASHEDVVKLLINAGASATAENNEGMTAIHLSRDQLLSTSVFFSIIKAAKEGDMEVIEAIIASSPKESLKTNSLKNGLAPIHVAAFYGKSEIVRELQTRVDINSKTDAPQMAGVVSDPELKSLITTDCGLTPLHIAAYMGRENVVRLILNNSSVNTDEETLLGRVPMFYAAMNGHLTIVSLLLSRSARHLSAKDKKNRQPLHLAAQNGHVDMVATLTGQGADLNCADDDGWTALHYATKCGYLNVVKLVMESGASPVLKTSGGKTPLMIAAAGGHIDLVYFLIEKEHDTLELMEDKAFLMDLMLCGLKNDFQIVEEFVLHSKAALYTVAMLGRLYRDLAFKEKERAKDLNDVGRFCEQMATKLLGIAAEITPPTAILRSTDAKGNQFLDLLLENGMKRVVEHAAVQKYLSDLWSGSLNTWPTYRYFMLFIAFLTCPPVMMYFCLPLQWHNYHHTPVIKFLAMLVSNLYLIGLLSITAGVPISPIVYRDNYYPNWEECACLAWIGGLLVTELTKSGMSTGLGSLRYIIIFFGVIATVFQMAAIAVDDGYGDGRQEALLLMYNRNFMLSFSLFGAIILIMDFMMIHNQFGPLGVIIANVTRDLMTFVVVLFIFLIGFTCQICCLFQSLEMPDSSIGDLAGDGLSNLTTIIDDGGNFTLVNLTTTTPATPDLTTLLPTTNSTKIVRCRISEKYRNDSETGHHHVLFGQQGRIDIYDKKRRKRSIDINDYNYYQLESVMHVGDDGKSTTVLLHRVKRKSGGGSFWTQQGDQGDDNATNGTSGGDNIGGDNYMPPSVTNKDPTTLILLFQTLYFAIFAMGGPDTLPTAKGGASWSWIVFEIMFGCWMIISFIILIPLLIAMLTETYKKIHMNSDLEWKFVRAQLIRGMIKQSAIPSPFNLFVRPCLYLWSVQRHGRLMCTKYASGLADEDEHEGTDEMLNEHHQRKIFEKSIIGRAKKWLRTRCGANKIGVETNAPDIDGQSAGSVSLEDETSQSRPMEDAVNWKTVKRLYRIAQAGGIDITGGGVTDEIGQEPITSSAQ